MNVIDVIAPEDLIKTPLRTDALRNGEAVIGERMLVAKDGSRIDSELSARMLPDGRIQAIVRDIRERKNTEEQIKKLNKDLEARVAERTAQLQATNRELLAEVTQRKHLEQQLREQAAEVQTQYERLAAIVANVNTALALFDTEGRVTVANAAWLKISGSTAGEGIGQRYNELAHYQEHTSASKSRPLLITCLLQANRFPIMNPAQRTPSTHRAYMLTAL